MGPPTHVYDSSADRTPSQRFLLCRQQFPRQFLQRHHLPLEQLEPLRIDVAALSKSSKALYRERAHDREEQERAEGQ